MNSGSVPDQGQRFLFASGACFFIGTTVVLGQDSLNERMGHGLSHEDHGMMATIGARGAGLVPPSASEFYVTRLAGMACRRAPTLPGPPQTLRAKAVEPTGPCRGPTPRGRADPPSCVR